MVSPSIRWGKKLESKLSGIAETSSKETCQALARFIGFNRKHSEAFCGVFREGLERAALSSAGRQSIYLSVIHETVLLEKDTGRWDRLADLRLALGETVVLPSLKCLQPAARDKLLGMLKDWDDKNCFGGPTLIGQIRKQLSATEGSGATSPETTTAASTAGSKQKQAAAQPSPGQQAKTAGDSPKAAAAAATAAKKEKAEESSKSKSLQRETKEKEDNPSESSHPEASTGEETVAVSKSEEKEKESKIDTTATVGPAASESSGAPSKAGTKRPGTKYDFESKGVPAGKVDAKEFLEPCRSIATLQIARDLRNDGAVQLSSLLSALPEDVRKVCTEAEQAEAAGDAGGGLEIPEQQARDFSIRIKEDLLDMDLEEQLANIRTFRDVIERQRAARQRLIYLLVKSRCKFGADEAAAAFHQADRSRRELKKRKQVLIDSMELEGLDVEETKADDADVQEDDLPALSWYKENDDEEPSPESKRARIEE